jgi:hypothetical protein
MNRLLGVALAALALGMSWLHQEASAADGGEGEGKPAAVATVSADAENEALPVVDGVREEWLEVRVRVIDADGEPVAKAKVTPWALRSTARSRSMPGRLASDSRSSACAMSSWRRRERHRISLRILEIPPGIAT